MELLGRAQSGDQQAFAQLTDGYRQELRLHCYRILGSTQDAEDALQETFLGAWQALANFEERASIRTWLYRIATNRCLNMLRAASRRPEAVSSLNTAPPEPTRVGEVVWLEPYPDILLDGLPDDSPGPDARYETRESVSLAFITVLQLLPPRQRVALVLRDVLGYRASEAAEMIEATEASVESALKRARVALHDRLVDTKDREPPPAPNSDSRTRDRRPRHRCIRYRRRGRARRPPHRRRLDHHAADTWGVRGSRGSGTLHPHEVVPPRTLDADCADSSEWPARTRFLRS